MILNSKSTVRQRPTNTENILRFFTHRSIPQVILAVSCQHIHNFFFFDEAFFVVKNGAQRIGSFKQSRMQQLNIRKITAKVNGIMVFFKFNSLSVRPFVFHTDSRLYRCFNIIRCVSVFCGNCMVYGRGGWHFQAKAHLEKFNQIIIIKMCQSELICIIMHIQYTHRQECGISCPKNFIIIIIITNYYIKLTK